MKINRREVAKTAFWGSASMQAALAQGPAAAITHGPFLGHVSMTEVWIWARTARSASFQVRYGLAANSLTETSPPAVTQAEHDNAAWMKLGGLKPGTRYYYQVGESGGSFQTLPSPDDYRDAETNPRGLFNFSFQFGSCADQKVGGALGATLPAYKTMLRQHGKKALFSIMNGDWVYEERRDYSVAQWREQ